MYNYDKNYISQRASKFGFIRDTLEKVYRLADILEYINGDPILKGQEQEFLEQFEAKEYKPELLFDDADIICRIKSHPMALWKIRQGDGN